MDGLNGSAANRPSAAAALSTMKPSPSYAWPAIIRNGGLYILALASVPLLARWHAWAPAIAMPLIGLAMYRLTIVMHDCIHGTLFASAGANRVVGSLAGAASGVEFNAFARLHRQHHRIVGEPADPQGPDYLGPWSRSRAGIVMHLLRPLVGANVFKLWQVARAHDAAERRPVARRLLPVLLAQACAAAIASSLFIDWWLAPLPVLSAATFGLFFAQLRGFAEHVAMPGTPPAGCVRSHRPNLIDRIFLYDLNFNYHREHHLHPGVPSCWLPQLRRRLGYEADGTSMFATIWLRLRAAPARLAPWR